MINLYLFITISLLIVSCNSKEQSKIDNSASEKAFNEGSELLIKSFRPEYEGTETFISLNKQAIRKFEQAYKYDTSNRHAWMYLPNCYYNIGDFEKAIYWFKKDSNSLKLHSNMLNDILEWIGLCYLNLGQFEKAKEIIEPSIFNDRNSNLTLERIKDVASNIFNKKYSQQISKLKSQNIDPCCYSIKVYEFALRLYKNVFQFISPNDKIILNNMKEKCIKT